MKTKTFEVALTYTVDDVITVEAEDEEQARYLAEAKGNSKISDDMLPAGLYWSSVEAYDSQEI